MSTAPALTVILPTHDRAGTLGAAIASVLVETMPLELLVIDDASSDETDQVLAEVDDTRLVIHRNERNLGLIGSLNVGLSLAKGAIIGRLDSDDVALPGRFAQQVAVLQDCPDVDIVGGNFREIRHGAIAYVSDLPTAAGAVRWRMLFECALSHAAICARAETLRRAGGYAPAAFAVEDYDLWLRLRTSATMVNLGVPVIDVGKHDGNVSDLHAVTAEGNVQPALIDAWSQAFGSQVDPALVAALRFPSRVGQAPDLAPAALALLDAVWERERVHLGDGAADAHAHAERVAFQVVRAVARRSPRLALSAMRETSLLDPARFVAIMAARAGGRLNRRRTAAVGPIGR